MKRTKKIVAALTSLSLAATITGCSSPAIGSGSATALTIDGYEVQAGVFIFYTLTSYYDARTIVGEDSDTTPTTEEVKNAHIDNLEASDWIQNKATEYCRSFVAVEKEFEKIGGELTDEELDEIDNSISQYSSVDIYADNGISESTMRAILENEYKSDHVFDYYYNFDGEKGCSEDELKDYFDENFARVKYINMSYLDTDGNEMDESGKKEIRDMAYDFADRVNAKDDVMDKLFEMTAAQDEYTEYVSEQEAAAEEEVAIEEDDTEESVTTTTTAVSTETTTTTTTTTVTTTTDPYANERLMQRQTTTTTAEDYEESTETTTTASASDLALKNLNSYVFDELELNVAKVFDDEDNDAIFVVIRADLRDRMTSDDLWSDSYISSLQQLKYDDEFNDYMEELADSYSEKRNTRAYRRYTPFKLLLETSSTTSY